MKVWNVGKEEINQLYNNRNVIIKSNQVIEMTDDLAVFLLNKKEVRAKGLVQLKDGDNKQDRYREGRENIYKWASEKWADYQMHCEEREAQRMQPLKPHRELLKFKELIDEYEKWVEEGSFVSEEFDEIVGAPQVVYGCPYCEKRFESQNALKGHLIKHKEEKLVDVSSASDESEGKSR